MPQPAKRTRRPKLTETLLTRTDFRDYPGLLEYLEKQAHLHARTPAEELVYRLLVAFRLEQRRGEKGKLGESG